MIDVDEEIVKLSVLLRDLIRKILMPVEKRLTLDQILEHPWIKMGITQLPRAKLNFNRMR